MFIENRRVIFLGFYFFFFFFVSLFYNRVDPKIVDVEEDAENERQRRF